jgi:heptosyltransferase-3
MPATAPESVRSILLVTLSNVGDAVLTTPVMEALHNKYPLALLDIVTDARAAALVAHCPYRRDIILKDKRAGWRGLPPLLKRLRTSRYDLAVDLRTDGLLWLLRARRRLGRGFFRPHEGHAVERHFAVISQRERIAGMPPPCVWVSAAETAFARQVLTGLPGQRWLALGPGARGSGKHWPGDRFVTLASRLREHLDAVILLGSDSDADICAQIAATLPLPCINLAGKTDLLQAAAVLQQALLFVGNDSGLGHLAAAAGTPTVTAFGPGDPHRYHPWHPQARWVQSTSGHVEDLGVDDVMEQVRVLLAECHKSE